MNALDRIMQRVDESAASKEKHAETASQHSVDAQHHRSELNKANRAGKTEAEAAHRAAFKAHEKARLAHEFSSHHFGHKGVSAAHDATAHAKALSEKAKKLFQS